MFRPRGYASQYRHGSPGMQQHPLPIPVPPPGMHPRGPPMGPSAYPGSHQQNLGFGPPPAMPPPPRASHAPPGYSTIPMQSLPNQGTPSSIALYGMPSSMPPPEPQQFPGHPYGPALHVQPPPQYPVPPAVNFSAALPPGPPTDIPPPPLPPRPSFSPLLPPQQSSGSQFSQAPPPSHIVPQHMPQPPLPAGDFSQPIPPRPYMLPENLPQPPPPPPAFNVCQPSPYSQSQLLHLPGSIQPPSALEFSQPPSTSINMSNPLPPSHSINLPPPPQKPNDYEMVQNIEILSEFVAKNGPEFENMARARQAGNPKFSFLFNGTPGSDAATGYQYFHWMKMKWELQMKHDQESQVGGQSAERLEQHQHNQQNTGSQFESQAVSTSPAVSDMDMDDDFPITSTSNKEGEDLYSIHPAGVLTFNEQEHKNTTSNMNVKATDGVEKEELTPINVADMDFVQSDLHGKEGVTFQQLTKNATSFENQAVTINNKGHENSTLVGEQQGGGSNVNPGGLNMARNYQEPEDLAHRQGELICTDSRTQHTMAFARGSGANMEDGKGECNEKQAFEFSHAGKGLGKASEYLHDHVRPILCNNDALKGLDHVINYTEVPTEEVNGRTTNPVNEGTSDSESDEVLYTANGMKKGHGRSRSQSPGDDILRSSSHYATRHRSRTRSPRRGVDARSGDEVKGICLSFARGMCYEGSSCKFVHHKVGSNSIVDYSDEESEGGKNSKEMEPDLKGSIGSFKSSGAIVDNINNTSPGKQTDGHDNTVAREENTEEAVKSDESSGKGEKSPEWDVDFLSESYSTYFDREIFQPSVMCREGSKSQPLRRDDFRPLPLRREDFEPQPTPRNDILLQPFQREGLKPQPLKREDLHPQFLHGEESRAHLLHREGGQPSLLLKEDMQRLHKQPFTGDDIPAQISSRDDLHAHPSFREGMHAPPLFCKDLALLREGVRAEPLSQEDRHALPLLGEDLHARPLRHEGVRSQPLVRGASYGQPLLREDFQAPTLGRDDLDRIHLLRKNILLDPLSRSDLRFRNEDLQRNSLLRDDIHFRHLLRENSRPHAEGLRPREDLHARLLSREDIHLKALARDLPSHQLDVSARKIDPLLFRNPSLYQNIALPVNSSFSSHSNIMRSPDPVRHGERHSLHPDIPLSMNRNPLSHPDLISSMREPGILNARQELLVSRPHTLPPHSPRNTSPTEIYRAGVQAQPTRSGSVSLDISLDYKKYCYSHLRGPSVPGPSTVLGPNTILTGSGSAYDPLFDSIESDMDRRLEKVGHKFDGGNSKRQPENIVENIKNNARGDFAVEAATDAEVGVVDNESPLLGGGREGSPGHPVELTNVGAGEIDVDQTHANEKTRNIKELRAMKVFRTALAEFAKELLKPAWREGNMSKEAFKTIVKKAVDKVAGSLQSHQVPNTQERIDQYLESSRHKFTKLVEGYVEKYVKD